MPSPHRQRLYSKLRSAVIPGLLCLAGLGLSIAQIARRPPKDTGPRALGLLELAANGKAHLVPIAILINGRFYDASVYKADPVPMALDSGTVYEAIKTGVSQGLFTVAGALQSQDRGWIGGGTWQTHAQMEAEKAKSKAEREKLAQKAPPPETEIGGPPKLKRGPESESKTGQNSPPQNPSAGSSAPQSPASTGSPQSASTNSRSSRESTAPQKTSSPSIEDANRPILRRQAPSQTTHEQTKSDAESEPLKGPLQLIPAISDADGPDPRPYNYEMKSAEERGFRDKMLALAAEEVRTKANGAEKSGKAKPPSPQFTDVQLHVFDLTNNNEPVLVLTANAKLPGNEATYMVVVVARQDIYADLHKAFASVTDNQHLDVTPRYELIDAVDANGDGAGDLLFRLTSDTGTAYNVYRVVGDTLWPLFEGKSGS